MRSVLNFSVYSALLVSLGLVGCGSDSSSETTDVGQAFSLNFAAKSGAQDVSCDTLLTGFGNDQDHSVRVSDLRFYVSNIKFYDLNGVEIDTELDSNEFQINHEDGFVGLIDFTSNDSGACADTSLSGTARTNYSITGQSLDTGIRSVSFDIGVPQAVMKSVINSYSLEDAPTPLNEMYWSWASGYRHFVLNFQIEDINGVNGQGNVHLGSRDCGGDGLLALSDQDSCDYVNTAKVMLDDFDPSIDSVVIDLDELLQGVSFASSAGHTESHTAEVTSGPGVNCHSSPTQADCHSIFSNLGVDMADGSASSVNNGVFIKN